MTKKQILKYYRGKCFFCEEYNYHLLTVHRIKEGSIGGKYNKENSLVICQNCHARIHYSKEIIIDCKYPWTGKGMLVHYFINNIEHWKADC